ncbi:MAG: GxxExxY protein [Planctomycetes bacterium]|nr:GxxExxY protein [Planctomycetota bacterium]MCW8135320.1 GxxExxY protein [Planctomycetota bacterium]
MTANWSPERIEAVAAAVVDIAVKIHVALGPGLLESVYVRIMRRELEKRGFKVESEVPVQVPWEGEDLGVGFRADLIVDGCVLIEAKSVEKNAPVHAKQALTYLRLLDLPLAIILNFGQALMKDGIQRVANGYYGPKNSARE